MSIGAVSKFGLVFYAKTNEATDGLARMEKHFTSMEMSLLALQGTAERTFQTIKTSLFGWGKALVDSAAKIESTKAQFQFAFKDLPDKGAAAFDAAVDAGLRMVQTTDEVINMATLMQRMTKVNIFDPKMEETMRKVNKDGLQFIDILGDMAAVNHYGAGGVTYALSEALTGQWRGFMMRMDMGKEEVEKYKKAVVGAKDNTEKLARMAPLLMQRFGGAAYSMKDTWKFLTAQIGDYKDKLFSTLGKPLMDALKPGLKALNDYMVDPQRGLLSKARIGELDRVVAVFGQLGAKVASLVSSMGAVAKYAITFVKAHPEVIKWATSVAVLTAGFAGMVTNLIALKVAVFAVGAAFGSMTVPILLITGAATAGAVMLAKWAVHGKTLADTWSKWASVASVVADVVNTMNGKIAKISMENAKIAEEKGVLSLAIKIGMWAYRVKEFFGSLWTGIKDAKKEIVSSFMPVFNQLASIALDFGSSASSSTEKWRQAGLGFARVLVQLVKGFAWLLDLGVRFGRSFVGTLKVVGAVAWAFLVRPALHLVNALGLGYDKLQTWIPLLRGAKVGFADILGVVAGIGVSLVAAKKATGMLGIDLKGTIKRLTSKGATDALAGVQKVYVVNMPGSFPGSGLLGPGGIPGAGAGAAGKAGRLATLARSAGLVAGAGMVGWVVGDVIANLKDSHGKTLAEILGDKMWETFGSHDTNRAVDPDAARKGAYGAKAQETQRYLDEQVNVAPSVKALRSGISALPSPAVSNEEVLRMMSTRPGREGPFIATLHIDGKQVASAVARHDELDRMRGFTPGE